MRDPLIKSLILSDDVLPSAWLSDASVRYTIFNPAITRMEDGSIALAYRVVGEDGRRRIGLCRLNASLSPIIHSAVPFSDLVNPGEGRQLAPQAENWFADPRLIWWQQNLYVYWNSGIHEPANLQFIQQVDPESLKPVGRCLTLEWAQRQTTEKNWSLFEYQGALHAFYTLSPAVVLRVTDVTPYSLIFSRTESTTWDSLAYTSRFGDLRGGASPILIDDKLYIFFHSPSRPILRYRYVAGLLVTAAEPPFQPLSWTPTPISLPNPFGRMQLPNPFRPRARFNRTVAEVIYPAGVSREGDALALSYGINDQHSAIAELDLSALKAQMVPVRLGAEQQNFLTKWRTIRNRAAGEMLNLAATAFKRRA